MSSVELTALAEQVAAAAARVPAPAAALRSDLDAVAARLHTLAATVTPSPTPVVRPAYPAVHVWVADWLTQAIEVDEHRVRWCPSWWAHRMAHQLLELMWRTWEAARTDPVAGMAGWWKDIYAPIGRDLLLSPTGPFAACQNGHDPAAVPAPLRVEPLPAALAGYLAATEAPGHG